MSGQEGAARASKRATGGGWLEASRPTAYIVAIAAAVIAAIGPSGEFPLSDDWSYAYAARELCTTGQLRLLPWTGASVVLQAAYGAALCAVGGFSFELLRASTLVLAVTGALGFALWLQTLGVRGLALGLAVVLVALNPLYVNLAFTFMTDVPTTVAAIWAAYFYSRGLTERRSGLVLTGSLLAAAALLIRQHGIFVAGAAGTAALLVADRPWGERLRTAAIALAIPATAFIAFHLWLLVLHPPPEAVLQKLDEAGRLTASGLINCAFRGLMYLGVFTAPLLIGFRHPLHAYHPRLLRGGYLLAGTLALVLFVRERTLMWYLTNVIYDVGLGALSLRDTQVLALVPVRRLGLALSIPLTGLAVVAVGRGVSTYCTGFRRLRDPAVGFTVLATGMLFAGTLVHTRYYFDRYLLIVLPFAVATLLTLRPLPTIRPISLALAAVLAWYAVAGTHDYMAWNRARFDGLAALEASGVPATSIDGGFEYNAWRFAPSGYAGPTNNAARPGQPQSVRSWWWVADDEFLLSFRPLGGYAVRQRLPYRRWLPPGTGHVFVLERRP